MNLRLLLVLLAALTLSACSALSPAAPTPLPTVVLGEGTAPQAPSGDAAHSGGGVTASGSVVPRQEARMAFAAGGSVRSVEVQVGEAVKAGQVLVVLAGGEEQAAAVQAASLEVTAARQALKKLQDGAQQARSAALVRLANAQKALDDAQKRRSWRQYRNGSQSAIESAQADLILANEAFENAEDAYSAVADRAEDDLARASALSALSAARRARDKAIANLNYLSAMPNQIEVDQAEAALQAAKAEVDSAQKELDSLKDGPDPDALALAEEHLRSAEAALAASRSALDNLELRAPFDGTVCEVNARSGSWLTPGQSAVVLADLQHLRVETIDLSERDVPSVEIGQPVTVFIKALNQDVDGVVALIAPLADTLGGDVVYRTTVDLAGTVPGLRAGMSVEVNFKSGK